MTVATPVRKQPARDDLLRLARRQFLGSGRVDIQALATELGISRATAYRWAGNTERLSGDVIAGLAEDTFRMVFSQARGKGAARIVDAMGRGMRYIIDSEPYRRFLERDPHAALRIVASKEGAPQGRMIELHQEVLEAEVAKGTLELSVDAHTMAYALVRTAETFMYADIIAGEQPDVEGAVEILKLLLGRS